MRLPSETDVVGPTVHVGSDELLPELLSARGGPPVICASLQLSPTVPGSRNHQGQVSYWLWLCPASQDRFSGERPVNIVDVSPQRLLFLPQIRKGVVGAREHVEPVSQTAQARSLRGWTVRPAARPLRGTRTDQALRVPPPHPQGSPESMGVPVEGEHPPAHWVRAQGKVGEMASSDTEPLLGRWSQLSVGMSSKHRG